MRLAKSFAEIDSGERQPAESIIKGYMPIGSIEGAGSVSVTAFELVVPARELLFQGVRFEVSADGNYSEQGIATVPIEEAGRLLASIEMLANAKINSERYALSEIEFTLDDLRVLVFNTDKGRVHAAVEANSIRCHLNRQNELLDLHRLVQMALEHLHANEF